MEKNSKKNRSDNAGDPRVEGIATVGWITLAALALSIPLTAVARGFAGGLAAALPVGIILGAGIMAMRIWSSGEKQVNTKENEALKERIRDLEERLGNLEMVDSLEAHFAERHRHPDDERRARESPPTMGPSREQTSD